MGFADNYRVGNAFDMYKEYSKLTEEYTKIYPIWMQGNGIDPESELFKFCKENSIPADNILFLDIHNTDLHKHVTNCKNIPDNARFMMNGVYVTTPLDVATNYRNAKDWIVFYDFKNGITYTIVEMDYYEGVDVSHDYYEYEGAVDEEVGIVEYDFFS